jgi:hypothetical protein
MFLRAFARPPSSEELKRWRTLAAGLAAERKVDETDVLESVTVWKDVAHTFFNTKEFLYLK